MGRPPRNLTPLYTRVPPRVMEALRREQAERGGSLGDAIERILDRGLGDDSMRAERDAARVEAQALLDVARRANARAQALEARLARVGAATKARARHGQ